jgi:predicted PurR-regulated permease PerM
MPFPLTLEQKQTAFWLAVWAAFFFLLVTLGPVLTPFLAAAIFAYALNPGVDRWTACASAAAGMPRALSVVIVVTLFFSAITALVLIVVPVLQKEIPLLQAQIPPSWPRPTTCWRPLQELGVKVRLDSAGIKQLASADGRQRRRHLEHRAQFRPRRRHGRAGLAGHLVLIPVVLFYLLLDWHAMLARIAGCVPRRWIGATMGMAAEVDTLLAQYLRGQLLVMLVLAVYYSVALAIAGFDVALPVGIITGLLVFIPYLGFGLGLVLALISAVLQFTDFSGLIAVAVIYGAARCWKASSSRRAWWASASASIRWP